MKHLYTLLLLSIFCMSYADSGIFESYVILEKNVNEQYYDCLANTPNPDFNNSQLGEFSIGESFILKGAQVKTWKNNGSNVLGAKVFYRIYKENTTPADFSIIDLGWKENQGSNNQTWEKKDASLNLIQGLPIGNYILEVYFSAPTSDGEKIDNNAGNNYKARLKIINPSLSLNGGKVIVTPKKPNRAENIKITFNATDTDLANAAKIYLHAGIGTDKPNSTGFNYTIGNWGQDDGVGVMTPKGNDIWEIEIPSINDYFKLPVNADAFSLNFLFRSEDGSLKEDFGNKNYHVELIPGPYFLIDTPTLSPYLTETNKPFEIKATASQSTHWVLYETNENGDNLLEISNNLTGETFSYQYQLTDTQLHYLKLETEFNGVKKFKRLKVQGYATPLEATMPVGTKKGINYNFPNHGEVTLVLHTPTSTTFKFFDPNNCSNTSTASTPAKKVVHLIGDFNDWQIKDDYKLQKDGDYWWITLSPTTQFAMPIKDEYIFQYLIDGEIKIADPYSHRVSDPNDQYIPESTYPNLISYPFGKTTEIATVLELNQPTYDWKAPNFERKHERNNLNVYELHFRDFTPEGTFKAATAKLDYLKDLGINTIHVMPISEFEGNDSWGYNPNFYFAVDKAYGTANDLKEFIDEAHLRGIAVVNDLVLNHAFYSNPNARMYWDKENNRPATHNPWFNATHKSIASEDGHWGADFNHGSEHTQKMVDDILKYWITEFKFDGFRFDFTKGFSQKDPNPSDPWASQYDVCRIATLKRMVDTMWAIDDANIEHYAIFEHLANDDEDRDLANHGILMWSGAGPQSDYIKMAEGNEIRGFEKSLYSTRGFSYPNYMSYMESHDEERIGYQVKNWGKDNDQTTAYLSNRLKLVAAFNLLMPGPRMVWQFGELGYDISLDDGGRTGRKPSVWKLGYDKDPERQEIYNLYSRILNFRNNYDLYGNNGFNMRNNANNTTDWARTMSGFDSQKNIQVISIGNFDTANAHTVYPGYFTTGTWYKYNGDPAIDGTPYTVNSKNDNYILYPNDPVYVLSNEDLIPPVFNVNPVTIDTDYCQYKLEEPYIISKGIWENGTTTLGKVADNSGNLTLKITKINGENTNLDNLNNFIPKNGENIIEWEATDTSGNSTIFNQSITINRGACYKSGAVGNPLESDVLISTLNRDSHNQKTNKKNGILVLESKNKGLVITTIPLGQNTDIIKSPVDGMIVFDENENCIKLYNGTSWACIQQKSTPNN